LGLAREDPDEHCREQAASLDQLEDGAIPMTAAPWSGLW